METRTVAKTSGRCSSIHQSARYCAFHNKRSPPVKKYTLCEVELEQVEEITYLGITLTSKLKWDRHVSSVSSKASKVLGVLRRNLHICPRSVRETAYKTLVRPSLEYGSAAWDPYYDKDIKKLERVQRKAARFCAGNTTPMQA